MVSTISFYLQRAQVKAEILFNVDKHRFHSALFQGVVKEAITFFEGTPVLPLPPPNEFEGSGVYGLYYYGDFKIYEEISQRNKKGENVPIYIGKAVPTGWRQGRHITGEGTTLLRRLNEHANSISQTSNLTNPDFKCRFMILSGVESDLVVPVEAELIRCYKPIWNSKIDGFGNHDPGAGRYNQAKSEWDVLHPGRAWAIRLIGKSPKYEDIVAKLNQASLR